MPYKVKETWYCYQCDNEPKFMYMTMNTKQWATFQSLRNKLVVVKFWQIEMQSISDLVKPFSSLLNRNSA